MTRGFLTAANAAPLSALAGFCIHFHVNSDSEYEDEDEINSEEEAALYSYVHYAENVASSNANNTKVLRRTVSCANSC